MKTSSKELNKLMKLAKRQGWSVYQAPSGHVKWVSPIGGTVITSLTASDKRAIRNITRDLIRNGLLIGALHDKKKVDG